MLNLTFPTRASNMGCFHVTIGLHPSSSQGSSDQNNDVTNLHTTTVKEDCAARITAIQNESAAKVEAIQNGSQHCQCPLYSAEQLDKVIAARTEATGNESAARIKALQVESAARMKANQKETAVRIGDMERESIARLEALQKESAVRIELMRAESQNRKSLLRAEIEARMKQVAGAGSKGLQREETSTQGLQNHCGTCNCGVVKTEKKPCTDAMNADNRQAEKSSSLPHPGEATIQFSKTKAMVNAIFKKSRELSEQTTPLTTQEKEVKRVVDDMKKAVLDCVEQEVNRCKQDDERDDTMPALEEVQDGDSVALLVLEQEEEKGTGEWGPTPDEVENLKEAPIVEGQNEDDWGAPPQNAEESTSTCSFPGQGEGSMEREQKGQSLGGNETTTPGKGFGETVADESGEEKISESSVKSVKRVIGFTTPNPSPLAKNKSKAKTGEEVTAATEIESGGASETLVAEQEPGADERGPVDKSQEAVVSQSAGLVPQTESPPQTSNGEYEETTPEQALNSPAKPSSLASKSPKWEDNVWPGWAPSLSSFDDNGYNGRVLRDGREATGLDVDRAEDFVGQSEDLAGKSEAEIRAIAAEKRAAAAMRREGKKRAAKSVQGG